VETIGGDLRQMQRTPLSASHVQALREAGKITTYSAGTYVARPGERVDRFVYVEEGEIEVVNPYTDQRHFPSTLGPTQFMGEIAFLNGGAWSMPLRTVRETRVIEVPREAMLKLMSEIPEMSDIIITVFSARRRAQLDDRDGVLRLIGEEERSTSVFLDAPGIPCQRHLRFSRFSLARSLCRWWPGPSTRQLKRGGTADVFCPLGASCKSTRDGCTSK